MQIVINGESVELDADPDMPLLWALRDLVGLAGTKYSCGIGVCGCCVVHVDGEPARSCVTPLSAVENARVTTIEGLSEDGMHPLQVAWVKGSVPQCGYCQPGQIMSAAALLASNPDPTTAEIDAAMAGNLCRCGTYLRIRDAIKAVAGAGRP